MNNPPKANQTSSSKSSGDAMPMTLIITIIVITVGLLLISCLVFILYMRRIKKKRQDSSSFTSTSDSSSQNTTKDLPSRPPQTITIPSGELKPVKSSVFVWKDSNRNQSANNVKIRGNIKDLKASPKPSAKNVKIMGNIKDLKAKPKPKSVKILGNIRDLKPKPKIGNQINKNIAGTKANATAVPMSPTRAQNKQIKAKPVVKPTKNIKPIQQNAPNLQKNMTSKPKVFKK